MTVKSKKPLFSFQKKQMLIQIRDPEIDLMCNPITAVSLL